MIFRNNYCFILLRKQLPKMKYFYALVILTAFLQMVNGKEEEEENELVKRREENRAATPFYFEQLLAYYLNLFQNKFRSNTMSQQDEKVLGYLLNLIYMRQKAIEQEEIANTNYWHLREG